MVAPVNDELELWTRYRVTRSVDLRNRLAERYQWLVEAMAGKLYAGLPPGRPPVGDLVSDGSLGLLSAVETYDPTRGVEFRRFACSRIRGAILDGLRDYDHAPRVDRIRWRRIDRLADQRRAAGLPAITAADVARALDVSEDVAAAELRKGPPREYLSIAAVRFETENGHQRTLAGILTDPHPGPSAGLEEASLFATALRGLSRCERMILTLYYRAGLTMKQVGQAVGIDESRVSQIHKELLARLRGRDDLRCEADALSLS